MNGASVGKRHFGPGDGFALPWRIKVPAAQVGSGGQVTMRKRRQRDHVLVGGERLVLQRSNSSSSKGKLALNITRDYYLLAKRQDKPTDPITYDLQPIKGAVHVGDIVAVRLALNGTDWKYLLAEDPIPAGTEFLQRDRALQAEQQARLVGRLVYAQGVPRRPRGILQYRVQRASRVRLPAQGCEPGKFAISPAQAGPMYQSNVQTTTDPATLEVQP